MVPGLLLAGFIVASRIGPLYGTRYLWKRAEMDGWN